MSGESLRIGLTGGIGSGKSTVASIWADAGAEVIDTDAIARQLTAPGGRAIPAILAAFGPRSVDERGALDRAYMRTTAFQDPLVKRELEAILHPMITAETQERASVSTSDVIVFDVPLLVESGRWRARVHRVLVVDCELDTQVARVVQRSHWPPEAVHAVIAQQATRERRRAAADAVIYNDGLDREALQRQVLTLRENWRCRHQAQTGDHP